MPDPPTVPRPPTAPRRINVEFVSANPTGPLHVGNARGAFVGDVLSRVLAAAGHDVTREYYFNDFGTQMVNLGLSVLARRRETEIPDDGYRGDYVDELAAELPAERAPRRRCAPRRRRPDRRALGVGAGAGRHRGQPRTPRRPLRRVEGGGIAASRRAGSSARSIGSARPAMSTPMTVRLWFRSTDFGDDKDRVILRSNGQPTYFASDIGYVAEKFERGFDELIYIWGADHHGTVARVRNAAGAMGYDREAVRMLLIAWVRFVRDGIEVPMSKRSGEFITLDEVLDEVGVDAARWFFSSRAYTSGIDFDLELAKKQSAENPVYYVQYAHARASSILRNAADAGMAPDDTRTGELLTHPAEQSLIGHLLDFPDAVGIAAERRETHEVPRYAYELASSFSQFYRDCKVLTDDTALSAARLALVDATRSVLANALGLLGISAPESM